MDGPIAPITLDQLHGLIGYGVRYRGAEYCVMEVLEDGPALVLQDWHHRDGLQDNQFGGPGRRVPESRTIPVLSDSPTELHEEFLSLELLDRTCH